MSKKSILQNKVWSYDGEIKAASVDFVQAFYFDNFCCDGDYDSYFTRLGAAGYDTVIIQWTRYAHNGECKLYYPSRELATLYDGNVDDSHSSLLSDLLRGAERNSFSIIVGLTFDMNWWDADKGFKLMYRNTEYMRRLAEIDNLMIDEITELYGDSPALQGWYWVHEVQTVIHKWYLGWADMLNLTIAHLNEKGDTRPLLFSPFVHWILRGTPSDSYRMWKGFFERANFRKNDIFCPQDSIAKISTGEYNTRTVYKTYRFLDACARAVQESGKVRYWINCEIYAVPKVVILPPEETLINADLRRIEAQYRLASRYAERVATFSFSLFFLTDGTYNKLLDKEKGYRDYCDTVKNLLNK